MRGLFFNVTSNVYEWNTYKKITNTLEYDVKNRALFNIYDVVVNFTDNAKVIEKDNRGTYTLSCSYKVFYFFYIFINQRLTKNTTIEFFNNGISLD